MLETNSLECDNKERPLKKPETSQEPKLFLDEPEEPQDDYHQEIFIYYKESEKKFPICSSFIISQPEITERLRKIMIDWMIKLHTALQLQPETLYLSINIMDRYLSVSQVRKDIYQLIAVSSVLAASKYEEVYPPLIDDFLTVTRNLFSRQQIVKMEYILLATLSYELSVPTSLQFMRHYLLYIETDEIYLALSHLLLESTLMDTLFYTLLPSQVAAGVIFLTNITQLYPPWSNTLTELTGYSIEMVRPWASLVRNHFLRLKSSTTLKGLMKKYTTEDLFQVAKLALPQV